MIGLKELELRWLDERKNVFLIIPIIAGSEQEALIAAQAHIQASVGYRPLNVDCQ
jgi:hypothetical protein